MMNRRVLLQGAAAALSWPAAPPVRARRPTVAQIIVIYDGRYADARAFADGLADAARVDTRSDLLQRWFSGLREQATRPGRLLLGMTPHSDLALVRGCAAETGRRVLYEGMHDCRGATRLSHQLRGAGALQAAQCLQHASAQWPATLARFLASAPWQGNATQTARLSHSHPPAPDHPGTLVSWAAG